MHQLRILWALAAFFFGDKSQLPKELATLIKLINQHCITFKAMQINDDQFFTKLGHQTYTRIFRWLQLCDLTEDKEAVENNIINLQPIVIQILNAQLLQVLPSIFKKRERTWQ